MTLRAGDKLAGYYRDTYSSPDARCLDAATMTAEMAGAASAAPTI
jgi:hypothetical protein